MNTIIFSWWEQGADRQNYRKQMIVTRVPYQHIESVVRSYLEEIKNFPVLDDEDESGADLEYIAPGIEIEIYQFQLTNRVLLVDLLKENKLEPNETISVELTSQELEMVIVALRQAKERIEDQKGSVFGAMIGFTKIDNISKNLLTISEKLEAVKDSHDTK